MTTNDKSALFIYAWRALAPDDVQATVEWIPEYAFNKPETKHRFDWACLEHRLAIEINGGRWKAGGGRHNTPADYQKTRLAVLAGWRVLPFLTEELETDPAACIALVLRALGMGEGEHE